MAETNYVFFNGKRVARRDPSGAVHYYLSDHLGSTTMVVSAAGAIENESDYYPWGGELKISATDTGNHYKFTGKERDAESGLDYFGARYYGDAVGRFIQVDPKQMGVRHLQYPQKWNRYAYVENNPLALVDPDGADDFYVFVNHKPGEGVPINWKKIEANAKTNGHVIHKYDSEHTTSKDLTDALHQPGTHVIVVGHTVTNQNGSHAFGISTDSQNGAVGNNAQFVDTKGEVHDMTPTGPVLSQSVAVFGCNSSDLAGQYVNGTPLMGNVDGAKTFLGLESGRTDAENGTDVRTEDRMAESYLTTATSSSTVDLGAAAAAAQKTLDQSTYPVDKGDKVEVTRKDE